MEKDLAKGMRVFKQLARFTPFIAGTGLTYADCAAGVHLPLISLSTKIVYGRDVLDDCAPPMRMIAFVRAGEVPLKRQRVTVLRHRFG